MGIGLRGGVRGGAGRRGGRSFARVEEGRCGGGRGRTSMHYGTAAATQVAPLTSRYWGSQRQGCGAAVQWGAHLLLLPALVGWALMSSSRDSKLCRMISHVYQSLITQCSRRKPRWQEPKRRTSL